MKVFTYSLSHWQHIWCTYLKTIFSSFFLKTQGKKNSGLAAGFRDKCIDIKPHCNIWHTLNKSYIYIYMCMYTHSYILTYIHVSNKLWGHLMGISIDEFFSGEDNLANSTFCCTCAFPPYFYSKSHVWYDIYKWIIVQ